jgi:5-(carboxyamino)imidazole ribonucleotide synthase
MPHKPLAPGSVIGILGGGQLGRFLAIAAAKLGLQAAIYAPEAESPAFQTAAQRWTGSYSDTAALSAFAQACGAITFEFENVPSEALEIVARYAPVKPSVKAAAIAQDRIAEKRFLGNLGVPIAPQFVIECEDDLAAGAAFAAARGAVILKRARQGYDGKGQRWVRDEAGLAAAWADFASPCVLEEGVDFIAEISVIGVRAGDGSRASCYDCPENSHSGGVLRTSTVPARPPAQIQVLAKEIAQRIADALDYCGVFAVEFFVMPNGPEPLIVNEIAPRVHNSGHWTLDACTVSQFENHIRAVAGWPIGSVSRHSDAVMTNLLGEDVLRWEELLRSDPACCLYLYGKSEVREGRKLGHVTTISPMQKK